jgi:gas vesicle protein GvpL/GvpF
VTNGGGALYVYGVMSAAERESLEVAGVEGAEVGTVEGHGLAALTSPVQGSALAAAREVRAHWRVLQEASESATVLPVRFGTVLEGEQAVRDHLLEPNAERLTELLDRLRGCVQLTVKGLYDEQALLAEVVTSTPSIAALRARLQSMPPQAAYYDRIRLGEMVAGEIARRREADTQHALQVLEPSARASCVENPSAAESAFDLSFLVPRGKQSAFGKRVRALVEEVEDRIDIRFVGPLPPYSFAEGNHEIGEA